MNNATFEAGEHLTVYSLSESLRDRAEELQAAIGRNEDVDVVLALLSQIRLDADILINSVIPAVVRSV